MDKIFYNQASSAKLGWNPDWFGEKEFNDELILAIKKWQKDHRITSDGLCGPTTYRRVYTERQSSIDDYRPTNIKDKDFDMFSFSRVIARCLKKYIADGTIGGDKDCSECGAENSLRYQEGCVACISCGSSKCS